jgi:hypothetical protein
MDIKRNGTQPSARGPVDWFTGSVRIDSAFQRSSPARVGGAMVTFEPGAYGVAHAPARTDFMGQLAHEGDGGPEIAYRFERFEKWIAQKREMR